MNSNPMLPDKSDESNESLLTENQQLHDTVEFFEERMNQLELAMIEDRDWLRMSSTSEDEFSRAGLRTIAEMCRIFSIKNPIIKRGIQVKQGYVWGQGVSIQAADDSVNEVVQSFLNDDKNRFELTGHQARMTKEKELQTDGNIFLVAFIDKAKTGRVRWRSIPFSQIDDIICNPDDAKEHWFYVRKWRVGNEERTLYYPDWRYLPKSKPAAVNGIEVAWDNPLFHMKGDGFSDWKFGLSEVYAGIDWAKAHTGNLEDWASIVKSYRRFAWEVKSGGGKAGRVAAKARLNSKYGLDGVETNPPPLTGSVAVTSDGNSYKPLSGGPSVGADDSRRLLLMVAASVGLPETFFGDVSVGTLATAKSLDRPTELLMLDRQTLWKESLGDIIQFAIRWAIKAPNGPLRTFGTVISDRDGDCVVERIEWYDIDGSVNIDFPPLVQHDMPSTVGAIMDAADELRDVDVTRMLLVALGEDDVDAIMAKMFDDEGEPLQPREDVPQAESLMIEAVRELREKLAQVGG